jgi:hypothetical protein
LRAAEIRAFTPITKFAEHDGVPHLYYHNTCRNTFGNKKELDKIIAKSADESSKTSSSMQRSSRRDPIPSTSRVYEAVCIFCQKDSKYLKGSRSCEALTQFVELRADDMVRNAALRKVDERILTLVSRDFVAAEAQYHRSCYRLYTKDSKPSGEIDSPEPDPYTEAEYEAYVMLFAHVRNDLFSSPRVIRMTDLTCKLTQFMQSLGIENLKEYTKKHIRPKLESDFVNSRFIINDNGKLLVFPDNLSRDKLAKENLALSEKLKVYTDDGKCIDQLLLRAALYLRDEVKRSTKKQQWPPLPEELDESYLPLPDALTKFYNILLSGESKNTSDRTQRLTNSFAEDCVYGITGGRQKSSKHILTSWATKTLTGNVELIKSLNRLGHGISYSQLEELDTALALHKLAIEGWECFTHAAI